MVSALGVFSATCRSRDAAPSGKRNPCSQLRTVPRLTFSWLSASRSRLEQFSSLCELAAYISPLGSPSRVRYQRATSNEGELFAHSLLLATFPEIPRRTQIWDSRFAMRSAKTAHLRPSAGRGEAPRPPLAPGVVF